MKKDIFIFGFVFLLALSIGFIGSGNFVEDEKEFNFKESHTGVVSEVSIGIPFEKLSLEKKNEIRLEATEYYPSLTEKELRESRYLTRNNQSEINLINGEIILLTN